MADDGTGNDVPCVHGVLSQLGQTEAYGRCHVHIVNVGAQGVDETVDQIQRQINHH